MARLYKHGPEALRVTRYRVDHNVRDDPARDFGVVITRTYHLQRNGTVTELEKRQHVVRRTYRDGPYWERFGGSWRVRRRRITRPESWLDIARRFEQRGWIVEHVKQESVFRDAFERGAVYLQDTREGGA